MYKHILNHSKTINMKYISEELKKTFFVSRYRNARANIKQTEINCKKK